MYSSCLVKKYLPNRVYCNVFYGSRRTPAPSAHVSRFVIALMKNIKGAQVNEPH